MVQKRFSIALDIKRPTANRDFEVVEGDNGNILEIALTDEGEAVDLTGCLVCAVFSKSDGQTAQQDNDGNGVTVDADQPNRLTIELYTTSFAPGLVECELLVYSGEDRGTLVTSAKFNFMCRRGIANADTIQAASEWPILVDLVERCEAVEGAEALRVIAEGGRGDAEQAREAYADKWRNIELFVQGLPHTVPPVVAVTEKADKFCVALGIPQGEPGLVNTHTHGNMHNNGSIGTAAGLPVFTGEGGILLTETAQAARALLEAASAAGMNALYAANSPLTTGGTAPDFEVTDAAVTAYTTALRRTIVFHEAGTAVTLNFNGLGAVALYEYAGKAANVKAGQIATVLYNGTCFFIVSGGGISLPPTITAGDMILHAAIDKTTRGGTAYGELGSGRGFTANRAGIYRVTYKIEGPGGSDNYTYTKLTKNGVDIPSSEISAERSYTSKKAIDVALMAGDVLKQLGAASSGNVGQFTYFVVCVNGGDIQSEIGRFITPLP